LFITINLSIYKPSIPSQAYLSVLYSKRVYLRAIKPMPIRLYYLMVFCLDKHPNALAKCLALYLWP